MCHDDLKIRVHNRRAADLLYAAIPPDRGGERPDGSPFTPTAALLQSMGIEGFMQYRGVFTSEQPFQFEVLLDEEKLLGLGDWHSRKYPKEKKQRKERSTSRLINSGSFIPPSVECPFLRKNWQTMPRN